MKVCPVCRITGCPHERKIYWFGLTKVAIVQKSLDATAGLFTKLMTFIPTDASHSVKVHLIAEDLGRCQTRITEIKKWMENKALVKET